MYIGMFNKALMSTIIVDSILTGTRTSHTRFSNGRLTAMYLCARCATSDSGAHLSIVIMTNCNSVPLTQNSDNMVLAYSIYE